MGVFSWTLAYRHNYAHVCCRQCMISTLSASAWRHGRCWTRYDIHVIQHHQRSSVFDLKIKALSVCIAFMISTSCRSYRYLIRCRYVILQIVRCGDCVIMHFIVMICSANSSQQDCIIELSFDFGDFVTGSAFPRSLFSITEIMFHLNLSSDSRNQLDSLHRFFLKPVRK